MKKLLSLVLTLWSLVGLAQTTTTKLAVIAPAPGKTGTIYTVSYERNWNLYPATTTGLNSLTTAIASGGLRLTVVSNGCEIPIGTRPPATMPTCNYSTGLPVLFANSGLTSRYTYTTDHGGTLQIRASGGSSGQVKLETVSGQTLTLSNSQNSTIPYNNYVGYGPSGDSSYPYDWTFWGVPQVPIKVSLKTGGAADVATFTPTVASNIALTGPNGTTVTPPITTTSTIARSYSNVIVGGNSITDYGQGKGYDASSPDKDYLHILTGRLRTLNTNVLVRTFKDFSGGALTDGPYWEEFHGNTDGGLSRFAAAAASKPDLLYISLGENVKSATNYGSDLINLVAALTAQNPTCTVVIRTTIWGKTDIDNIIQATAAQKGWIFVDARNITGARSGADFHPNDQAMQTIADLFWNATPKTTTITTPPTQTTTTTPTSGSVDAQGFLVYQDQGWSGNDIKRIENSEMFLEFKRSVGACVTGAGLKSNNRNVVNDEQVTPNGVTISDKGVQWQLSPYAWPAGGQPLTIGTETRGGTGDNPVQGGSANPYFQPGVVEKSAIINTPDRGVVFCAQVNGLLWDWFSVKGHMPVDIEWWFLPGKVITYKARLTVNPRPSNWSGTQRYQSLSQEMLCLYNIGAFNTHIAQINGNEISLRDGVPLGGQSNDYFTSGCWAATYQPDRSQGVLYYTPRNSIFKSWQKVAEQGEWPDPGMSYINSSVKRTYDIAGTVTVDNGYIILGSQSEAMARMAQLEPIDQSYDFDFTSLNNQWWNEDARVMRNSSGGLRWYCGDEKTDNGQTNTFGRFLSPARAWQASQFANVEFDMAVSGVNKLLLKWAKPGRFGQYEYSQEITVNGDGQRRTYQFNLSNLPNWGGSGTITYLGLQATVPGQPAAYVDMYRARKF